MRHLLIYIKKLREFAGFKLYVNLIGMTVISFLEGIGIFLLVPALGLIGIFQLDTSGIPFVSYLVKPLQAIPEGMRLPVLLGGFILLIAGQALMQRKQTNLNMEIQHGFIRYLRVEIYQGLLQAELGFFSQKQKIRLHACHDERAAARQHEHLSRAAINDDAPVYRRPDRLCAVVIGKAYGHGLDLRLGGCDLFKQVH